MIRICTVESCDRLQLARGWCPTHWRRWRTHGDVKADIPIQFKSSPEHPRPSLVQPVLSQTGATYRQLDYWASQGWIPALETNPGTGHARTYSLIQLQRISLLVRASNLTLPEIADFLERLDQESQGAA